MGDLSKNFSRHEFACKCGCGADEVSPKLIETLQTLRTLTNSPITITSGRRCQSHNATVGGVANSQHVIGNAADVIVKGWAASEVLKVLQVLVRAGALYVGYAYAVNDRVVHIDVREPESDAVKSWRAGVE